MMNPLCFLIVFMLLLQRVSLEVHSLRTACTASSGLRIPEFIAVTLVDELQLIHYDSGSGTLVPSQPWVQQLAEQKNTLWDEQRQMLLTSQLILSSYIQNREDNHTAEVQVLQELVGCEWDSDTNLSHGFLQFGLNGKDFVVFEPQSQTWIAATPQAVSTKRRWERRTEYWSHYLSEVCPQLLKSLLQHGISTLKRTELPAVSLLFTPSSSSVSCFATGFYPHQANLFWVKDGEELFEGVEISDTLPNEDGTFQKTASLDLSWVRTKDRSRYHCVFQILGVKDDLVYYLEGSNVVGPAAKRSDLKLIMAIAVLLGLLMAFLIFVICKRKCERRRRSQPGMLYSDFTSVTFQIKSREN